jgi:hypothetical protein
MVLEEMYVDDGSKKMQEHINNTSVGRSLANYSAKGRNFGGVVILPRPVKLALAGRLKCPIYQYPHKFGALKYELNDYLK